MVVSPSLGLQHNVLRCLKFSSRMFETTCVHFAIIGKYYVSLRGFGELIMIILKGSCFEWINSSMLQWVFTKGSNWGVKKKFMTSHIVKLLTLVIWVVLKSYFFKELFQSFNQQKSWFFFFWLVTHNLHKKDISNYFEMLSLMN